MTGPAEPPPGPRPALLIMAKAPVPGVAKTRLQPLLGRRGCARLQAALIGHAAGLDNGAGFLAHTPADSADLVRPLVGPRMVLFAQRGDDLGQRMAAAVDEAATRRPGPVILIGTDCPTLRPAHLRAAATHLGRGCDVVLGPAHDGGYYLIGFARPAPRVFAIPPSAWGGGDVTAATVDAADKIGLRLGFLDLEHDLDTPRDVEAILPDPRLPAEIAAILRSPGPGPPHL